MCYTDTAGRGSNVAIKAYATVTHIRINLDVPSVYQIRTSAVTSPNGKSRSFGTHMRIMRKRSAASRVRKVQLHHYFSAVSLYY